MEQEKQIQNGDGSQAGVLQIAFSRALDAIDDIEQPMASLRYKGIDVEGKARLQDPQTLEAESGSESRIGDEESGLAGKKEREEGAEEGDPGGDGVAFGLELGGLDGGRGGGDGGVEVEESGAKGEEKVVGERKEGREALGEEEGKRKDKEEEQNGGVLEGSEAVDWGSAFEERVGVVGDEGLVGQGHDQEGDEEVELQVFEAVRRRRR